MRLPRVVPKTPAKSSVPPRSPTRNRRHLPTHSKSTLPQVLIPLHFNSFRLNAYAKSGRGTLESAPKFCNSSPGHPVILDRREDSLGPHCSNPLFAKSAHQYHSMGFARPLFSYSYALFCTPQNAIPNVFSSFHTLCPKHPGGVPVALETRRSPTRLPTRSPSVTIPPTPGAAHD
jgi:hypothetical protein